MTLRFIKRIAKKTGRPPDGDATARLVADIDRCLSEDGKTDVKAVIAEILGKQDSFKKLSKARREAKIHSCQVAYSDYKHAKKVVGHESMDEYATRRKAEMRQTASIKRSVVDTPKIEP